MATAIKSPAVFALVNVRVEVVVVPASLPVCCTRAMFAAGVVIVKAMGLLAWPPTVTVTLPLVAPLGTGATMLVALQLVGVAAVPLNLTVLVHCVVPKFVPVIVTGVATGPELTERLVIFGAGTVTVKVTPLLVWPLTGTVTLPLVAPLGTGATMLVA